DEPILMQQGSLIEMTGPKRAISLCASVLFEFDMRIKNGDQEEDDLQLIDGAVGYCELGAPCWPFTNLIKGDYGAVDITLALIYRAVEATIEVVISELQNSFHLSLSSLRRYVVAVVMDTWMHLKFRVGQNGSRDGVERYISFEANQHGCAGRQVMFEFTSISVKVTWSTLPT
uniref:DUF6598 domain-containing protein n=1 Tax=Setaria italica TaxID=4555 RepID=K3YC65_SETIT